MDCVVLYIACAFKICVAYLGLGIHISLRQVKIFMGI